MKLDEKLNKFLEKWIRIMVKLSSTNMVSQMISHAYTFGYMTDQTYDNCMNILVKIDD